MIVVPYEGIFKRFERIGHRLHYEGQEMLALKYTPAIYKTLVNLNVDVANPVLYFYEFPIQFGRKPFRGQLRMVDVMTSFQRGYVISDMGAGKTLSALWAFDWLKKAGLVDKMLVVANLSTLVAVWQAEAFQVMPQMNVVVVYGTAEKRRKLLEQDADIYIINHDGVKVMADELAKRRDIDMLVIDELTNYKERRTDRWKIMNRLVNKVWKPKYVWGLTGTPTPQAPTDAYGQCKLVTPWTVPTSFSRFQDATMLKVSQFTWVPKRNANDIVREAMQPSIRVKRPTNIMEPQYSYRDVEFTPEQKRIYKKMMTDFKVELAEGKITAENEGVKLSKLLQIGCGFAYDPQGRGIRLEGGEKRSRVVRELIEQAPAKTIVFVPFTEAVAITAEGLGLEYVNGKWVVKPGGVEALVLPKKPVERADVFNQFQHGTKYRALIAHPKTMSHGLNLTAAATVVWVSPYPSLETFLQANHRIIRPGQLLQPHIVMLKGSPVEELLHKRNQSRQKMQGALLELLERPL